MFKKLLYLFIGLVLTATVADAQLSNYKFGSDTGTVTQFVPITGGTTLSLGGDNDDGVDNNLPIGFTFNFNGINYTTFGVCANGFMGFNTLLPGTAAANWTNNLTSSTAAPRPLIAPYWDDLLINGSVSYVTTGISPFRVLTVQWLNAGQYTGGSVISFQVKLYESSNMIDFYYRQETGGSTTAGAGASIGLAAVATGSGNFLSLQSSAYAATTSTTVEVTTLLRPTTTQVFRFDPIYCTAKGGITVGSEEIANVTFNTINNSSTKQCQYENFTNVGTAVTPGNTYALTVTNNANSYSGDQCIVFIDYNRNGVFTDAGETVMNASGAGNPYPTVNVTIPLTASLGITRMRVRLNDAGSSGSNATSCGQSAWAQVEDYTINIQNCTASAESVPPSNTTTCVGANASFTVVASGTGTTYQWQVSTDNGANYSNVANAAPYSNVTTATLNITGVTAAMNGYRYRCTLGGTCTPAGVNSSAAILTVNTAANVTAQPVATATCTGNNATFSITATGSSPAYQWQVSTDNGANYSNVANGGGYAGVTTNSLSITGAPLAWNNNLYRCQVTVAGCGTVNSTGAKLTVWALPTLTIGASPYTRLFPGLRTTISASALPASASNVFTWYRNGAVVGGSTGASIIVDVDGMGTYNATVKDGNGCVSALSNSITILDSVSSRLFIYPNPTVNGQFQVRYYSVAGNAVGRTVTVFDSKGSRVWKGLFAVGKPYDAMIISLKNHGRGIYNVELGDRNGKRIITGRVLVM